MDDLQQIKCCGSGPPEDRPDAKSSRPPKTVEAVHRSPGTGAPWIVGSASTAAGEVPCADTVLRLGDRLGAWKARWAIGRMRYRVEPGLYAVGQPTPDSPVLLSANYKMSFDRLRAQLAGLDAWILVLDTQGINVWCAAGKGTFGTDEIVRRIEAVRLAEVVSHRTLVVPQLGAPGVAAHQVKRQSGFRVLYGPVRAEDLPAFLAAGMKATPEMRRVHFPLRDRLAVIPVELVISAKYLLLVAAGFFFLGGLGLDGYSWERAAGVGVWSAIWFLAAAVGGMVFTPTFLPWLPGRAFAVKGTWLGLAFLAGLFACRWFYPGAFGGRLNLAAWCLLIPVVASFTAMNFTGASTYTSLSGVRREMRVAVPVQAAGAVAGVALWLVGRFV